MQSITRAIAALLTAAALSVAAQQVYKCPGPNGGTVFQQAPCTDGARVRVTPGNTAAAVRAPEAAATARPASRAAAQIGGQVAQETAAALPMLADRCLDYYRPRLRDPRGAYHTAATLDKRVLRFNIHATNGYGGYVIKSAACEVMGNDIDPSWSAKHAIDYGWK